MDSAFKRPMVTVLATCWRNKHHDEATQQNIFETKKEKPHHSNTVNDLFLSLKSFEAVSEHRSSLSEVHGETSREGDGSSREIGESTTLWLPIFPSRRGSFLDRGIGHWKLQRTQAMKPCPRKPRKTTKSKERKQKLQNTSQKTKEMSPKNPTRNSQDTRSNPVFQGVFRWIRPLEHPTKTTSGAPGGLCRTA